MTARALLTLFDATYLIGLTAWIGAILFFSFGVAPVIFKVLDASSAAKFVRTLFPRYYAWGATAATVALASFTSGVLIYPEFRGVAALVQILGLLGGVLVNLYCGNVLTPKINQARDAGPEQSERFDRLHRLSVRLNAAMMLGGLALIVAFASRPEPAGPPVRDPKPWERSAPDASEAAETASGPDAGSEAEVE